MKYGARRPSVKKSVSARTKGRATRTMKKLGNPFYGRKGVGWIKNPKRAARNKIYHATTFSLAGLLAGKRKKNKDGPVTTAISYIIVLCIFGGILQSVLPALGTIVLYAVGIIVISIIVYLLIMFFSSRPANTTSADNSEEIQETAEDIRYYHGIYDFKEYVILLTDTRIAFIDVETNDPIECTRTIAKDGAFNISFPDGKTIYCEIAEDRDALSLEGFDFDRIQFEDLKYISRD